MRPHFRPGPRDTVFDRVGTLSPSTGTGRKFRPRVQPALGNWLGGRVSGLPARGALASLGRRTALAVEGGCARGRKEQRYQPNEGDGDNHWPYCHRYKRSHPLR